MKLVLILLLASPLAGQNLVIPSGAYTDCGMGGARYTLKPEAEGKERYGPGFGCPTCVPISSCIVSEADKGVPMLYEELHGLPLGFLTERDATDIGLIAGLARSIAVEHCQKIGNCSPDRPLVMSNDRAMWSVGKAPAGEHPGNCPQVKATQSPCGLNKAWDCYWQQVTWVDNKAPHCGGSAPAPPPPVPPPVDPPPPAVECQSVPVEILAWANRMCEGAEWTAEKIGGARHRQLCQQRDRLRAYRPVLQSTGQNVMNIHWLFAPEIGSADFVADAGAFESVR